MRYHYNPDGITRRQLFSDCLKRDTMTTVMVLQLKFRSGSVYNYYDVPRTVYDDPNRRVGREIPERNHSQKLRE